MARTSVTFSLDSGLSVELEPGDLIGRATMCALRVADSRISEAHAMVSRRREGLVLLALRGRMSVDGKPRTRISLELGARALLAGFFPLVVASVHLPTQRLVVVPEVGGAHLPLSRIVTFYDDSRPPVGWFDPDGAAHILGGAQGPRLRRAGHPDTALVAGGTYALQGSAGFKLVTVEASVSEASTSDQGNFDQSLKIIVRFDTVNIASEGGKGVTFDGSAARIISELAEIKAPLAWSELALILWDSPPDDASRHRWDQLLLRIRSKLRAAGIRADLLRSNRKGLVELVLGPGDKLLVKT